MFYKNIEAEIFEILKNISRINPGLKFWNEYCVLKIRKHDTIHDVFN